MGLWDLFRQKAVITSLKPPFSIEKSRYPANDLIALWEQTDKSMQTVSLESETPFFSVEVIGLEKIDHASLVQILNCVDDFDTIVQNFCKENYDSSQFDMKNYMVALSWISIKSDCKIVMGYWGECVNIELRAVFEKEDDLWKNTDLYYQ